MGAAADFRRDLEDLVCDHLGGCFSPPPSSSSSCSAAAGGGAADHEPDGEAESSAARRRRRESRLLSRWVARQAEEVLSSMEREVERRNREAELLALARLHPVSTLDPSSFLLCCSSPCRNALDRLQELLLLMNMCDVSFTSILFSISSTYVPLNSDSKAIFVVPCSIVQFGN